MNILEMFDFLILFITLHQLQLSLTFLPFLTNNKLLRIIQINFRLIMNFSNNFSSNVLILLMNSWNLRKWIFTTIFIGSRQKVISQSIITEITILTMT